METQSILLIASLATWVVGFTYFSATGKETLFSELSYIIGGLLFMTHNTMSLTAETFKPYIILDVLSMCFILSLMIPSIRNLKLKLK